MNLPVTKAQIVTLVPHAGNMCLIDEVITWNDTHIECMACLSAQSYHPLCLDGELSVIHLLEYGAQAMAVHAGLLRHNTPHNDRHSTPVPGFLAAIRDARFFIESLHGCDHELHIQAYALIHSANGVVYELTIADDQHTLLVQARTTVIHINESETP